MFQFVFISHECLQEQLLILRCQPVFQRLSGKFNISGTGIADGGNVIYFHIHAVFSVAVLNKDQVQIHGQECLDLKMSTVVISRRVKILETVQAVFHGMIADMVLIQVVADGIGIAVDINVLVSPKIYRHIRSLESGVLLRKADPVLQIPQKASGVLPVFFQFREEIFTLLIEFQYLFEQSRALHPGFQVLEIIGHFGQH